MNKVSIIIPCYNQAKYLADALRSVLEQTYENWECIIINDGSPDTTEEVAREWIKKDSRFKYIYKSNGGLSDARNVGIANSNGIYILPLDADDKIAKQYLYEAVRILDKNTKIKIIYGEANFFGVKTGKWKLPKYQPDRILIYNMIYCSALFRRSDYDKTTGYNSNMIYGFEDWDFWLSILSDGGEVFRIPQKLFFYRVKELSMIKNIDEAKKKYLHRQIYINHIELYNKLSFDPITLYKNNVENSLYYKIKRFIKKVLKKD